MATAKQKDTSIHDNEDKRLDALVEFVLDDIDKAKQDNAQLKQYLEQHESLISRDLESDDAKTGNSNSMDDNDDSNIYSPIASANQTLTFPFLNDTSSQTQYRNARDLSLLMIGDAMEGRAIDEGSRGLALPADNDEKSTQQRQRPSHFRAYKPAFDSDIQYLETAIKETEAILTGVDDNEDGDIDGDEFAEAVTQIDGNIHDASIKAMYDLVNGYEISLSSASRGVTTAAEPTSMSSDRFKLFRHESVLEMKRQLRRLSRNSDHINVAADANHMLNMDDTAKSNGSTTSGASLNSNTSELNIQTFITYLRHNINEHHRKHMNNTKITPKQLIRICFGDIIKYTHTKMSMDVTTTKLWGVEQRDHSNSIPSPLQQLRHDIMDEADDEQTLDFTEFKSAIENLSLSFAEKELQILFCRISKQQASKRAEIEIDVLMQCIQRHADASQIQQHAQPAQILDTALRNMLRTEKAVEHHLRVNGDHDSDAETPESSPNPYYDESLMQSLHRDYAPDAIQKFEKVHSVKDALKLKQNGTHNNDNTHTNGSSSSDKQARQQADKHEHKLVHLHSFAGWQTNELDDMETAMKARISALSQQNESSNKMMQVVHEDLDEDADFESDNDIPTLPATHKQTHNRAAKSHDLKGTKSTRKKRPKIARVDSLEKWKTHESNKHENST